MCLHEIFSAITNCANCVELKCPVMRGQHTWYQLGVTLFSFAQMVYQLFHFTTVAKSMGSLTHLTVSCKDAPEADYKQVQEAEVHAQELIKQEQILTIFAVFYFSMLVIFELLFECCKIDQKYRDKLPQCFTVKQFKLRQGLKFLLQIGLVVLVILIYLTAKKNDNVKSQLEDIPCCQNQQDLADVGRIFDTSIIKQALVNLIVLIIQVVFDYNCLMFPEVKHSFEVWEAHHHHHQPQNNHSSDETRKEEYTYPPVLIEPKLPRKTVRYVRPGEQKQDKTQESTDSTPFQWPPSENY